jgi:hypothetical protein
MCLVFAVSEDLDDPCKDLLSRAYEAACDELQSDHQLSSEALGQLVEAMTTALLDLYHAGQRDERRLARYAVWRALSVRREKSLGLEAPRLGSFPLQAQNR